MILLSVRTNRGALPEENEGVGRRRMQRWQENRRECAGARGKKISGIRLNGTVHGTGAERTD